MPGVSLYIIHLGPIRFTGAFRFDLATATSGHDSVQCDGSALMYAIDKVSECKRSVELFFHNRALLILVRAAIFRRDLKDFMEPTSLI